VAQQAHRDQRPFAEVYQEHVRSIYRYHLIRTGSAEEAQDLTSQTFLAALESFHGYSGRGSLAGWLFGIARHKVADFYRQRRGHLPLDSAAVQSLSDSSPEDAAAIRLQLARVAAALRTLPSAQAEALVLRLFSQLSAAEAGHVMGKSPAAVKMLVHRGLRNLREKLGGEMEVWL